MYFIDDNTWARVHIKPEVPAYAGYTPMLLSMGLPERSERSRLRRGFDVRLPRSLGSLAMTRFRGNDGEMGVVRPCGLINAEQVRRLNAGMTL